MLVLLCGGSDVSALLHAQRALNLYRVYLEHERYRKDS